MVGRDEVLSTLVEVFGLTQEVDDCQSGDLGKQVQLVTLEIPCFFFPVSKHEQERMDGTYPP